MDPVLILTFIILFSLSAFFSWSEIALMSMPIHKIESLIKQRKYWANDLKLIRSKQDRLLTTILIWNNLVNVYIASLATQISIDIAKNSWLEESFIIWITTWIITFLLLLFWEIVPKSFWVKNAQVISLLVAKPYKYIMTFFFPISIIIEIIVKLVTWKSKVPQITDEEMESFIDMWKDSGLLEASEHEKIKNMLEFSDINVEEIFTPRVKIDALDIETTVDEAIEFLLNQTHSRIPVYKEQIDNIDYVVNLRFLLSEKSKWNGGKKLLDLEKLDKVIKIPLNFPIDKLLETFRHSRKHLAVVMDEYGWIAWLVTLEDIIEQVFWEIRDEFDREKELIISLSENKFEVDSSILFEDLIDELNISFSDLWLDEKEYYAVTLNYFITQELERFPNSWETLEKQFTNYISEKEWLNKYLLIKIQEVIDSKMEKIIVSIEEK